MPLDSYDKRSQPIRIACVGGGIGGLALALGLANQQQVGANIDFQVFEAAPRFTEIGAGVGIGPNAYQAISLLGLKEAYEKIAATEDPEESKILFIWRYGEKRKVAENGGDDEFGFTPCNQKGGHATIHRARFLDMMIDRLPTGIANFNKRLIKYTLSDPGDKDAAPVTLHFHDGTTYEADLLLGADGIKSTIRPQMLAHLMKPEELRPQFTGTIVYRGLFPMEKMVERIGEKARKGTMYLGKNKHILTAPLQHGKVINIVAFSSDRTVSSQDPVWSNADWIVPGTAEEMMEGWEDWSEDVGQIVRSIEKPNKWALHELCDLPTHAVGPVCIVGDSAAATLPHQGQGAAAALEGAYTFAAGIQSLKVGVFLAICDEVNSDVIDRHVRATRIKTTSNELGRLLEFSDGIIDGERIGLKKNLKGRYDWMWDWDGIEDVNRGLQMIKKEAEKL
ncbi:MAG: hypothetical protein CYPHOPRED_003556 [Cyphobasidiales sp. Tagirdzhanova-0007]|nr:MAG: hypothetical protein CYPHOPRED_003556 [Cyphobasidiales sp. Tagirdzhanova-0007]